MRVAASLSAILFSVIAGLASSAQAQEPIVIKFSHVVATDTPKGKAAEYFKNIVEARTHGRVHVDIFANGTLFNDKEEMDALIQDKAQMLAPSLAKFRPMGVKEFEAFDLPFLFDSYQSIHKITNGPVGQALLKKLEAKGIVGLGYWDNGFKVMSANKPLRMPEDFKGLKMRIQPSKVLEQQMRDLGAIPKTMAFSEVYPALQSGAVDGTETDPSNLYTQKMHEVQKFVTVSNHGYIGYAVIVSKKFWDKLPGDIRNQLEGAFRDTIRFENEMAKRENDNDLDWVRNSGKTQVITLTPEQKLAWRKVLSAVYAEQGPRIGQDVIDSITQATGYDPTKF